MRDVYCCPGAYVDIVMPTRTRFGADEAHVAICFFVAGKARVLRGRLYFSSASGNMFHYDLSDAKRIFTF